MPGPGLHGAAEGDTKPTRAWDTPGSAEAWVQWYTKLQMRYPEQKTMVLSVTYSQEQQLPMQFHE